MELSCECIDREEMNQFSQKSCALLQGSFEHLEGEFCTAMASIKTLTSGQGVLSTPVGYKCFGLKPDPKTVVGGAIAVGPSVHSGVRALHSASIC